MALIQAVITVAPWVLCNGTPATVGDQLVLVVDVAQFVDAEPITAEIISTEEVTIAVRGCPTQLTCAIAYTVEFDDSMLPVGLSELLNCHLSEVKCASCCEIWRRDEYFKVVLQADAITEAAFYTQVRLVEDVDLFGFAVWVDNWPSVYGEPGPHLDVDVKLQVSAIGGNSATTDIAGAEITLLRATPETWKKLTFPAPIRLEAGRQVYLTVTESGGTVPPEGLGVAIFYRLASDP